MTIEQYQEQAKRTCPTLGSYDKDMTHMKLGVFTECGELLDAIKNNYAYGKPLDLVNIGEEIGDIAWYVVNRMAFKGMGKFDNDKSITFIHYSDIIECLFVMPNQYDKLAIVELVGIANYFNLDFYELLNKNIAKLKARYPEKFDTEKALNRDLEKERKILED